MTAFDVARRVLGVAQAGLEDAGRPVPARVCVAPGSDPTWNCEQLTVQVTRPNVPGTPGREGVPGRPITMPGFVELRVELVRPVVVPGNGRPASVADTEQAAEDLLADADALQLALFPRALTGRPGVSAQVQPAQTLGPAGGYVSVAIVVALPA